MLKMDLIKNKINASSGVHAGLKWELCYQLTVYTQAAMISGTYRSCSSCIIMHSTSFYISSWLFSYLFVFHLNFHSNKQACPTIGLPMFFRYFNLREILLFAVSSIIINLSHVFIFWLLFLFLQIISFQS